MHIKNTGGANLRIDISFMQEFDWRDYTCFWHELTKLSYPDSIGQISTKRGKK
jgi:mRNA deadenylase 3'-5' endonuclease subunit Ccr4